MAQRTTADETMTREQLGDYLAALAREFERGEEEIDVRVGNKSVSLHPPEEVDCTVEVTERSSKLRRNRKTIEIDLSWAE